MSHTDHVLGQIYAAFPVRWHTEVAEVMRCLSPARSEPNPDWAQKVEISTEAIQVPYRIYFDGIARGWKQFSETKRVILAALMTRHHSGYQRMEWAARLCEHPADWTAPYIALLLGDYVDEILRVLEQNVGPEWNLPFASFVTNNPLLRERLNRRIVSYWHSYYRQEVPRFAEYPGFRVAERLGVWDHRVAPNLIRRSGRAKSSLLPPS